MIADNGTIEDIYDIPVPTRIIPWATNKAKKSKTPPGWKDPYGYADKRPRFQSSATSAQAKPVWIIHPDGTEKYFKSTLDAAGYMKCGDGSIRNMMKRTVRGYEGYKARYA